MGVRGLLSVAAHGQSRSGPRLRPGPALAAAPAGGGSPEPFGALLHFGTRKLSFLKNRTIVEVVESLADHPTTGSACRAAGIDDATGSAYLHVLVRSDMLVREETP